MTTWANGGAERANRGETVVEMPTGTAPRRERKPRPRPGCDDCDAEVGRNACARHRRSPLASLGIPDPRAVTLENRVRWSDDLYSPTVENMT